MDLQEIALAAMDEAEENDSEANSDSGASEQESSSAGDSAEQTTADTHEDDSSEDETDKKGEENDSEDNSDGDSSDNAPDDSDNTDKPSEGVNSDESKPKDSKELTDDEFEELAKKRGYAKAPSEDEKRQSETEAETLERLTRKPSEIPEEIWENTGTNNKIVYNALPVITARGKNGKTVNVKIPQQLPDDFEFENDKARTEYQAEMAEQNNRSNNMLNALNERDQQIKQAEERRQFAQQIVNDVTELQNKGELPKPSAKSGTPEFDSDPAVAVINKVLAFHREKSMAGYNLSISDATKLYKLEHPEDFAPKQQKQVDKADSERANVARKISGGKKASDKKAGDTRPKPIYEPGSNMSLQDIADAAMARDGIE